MQGGHAVAATKQSLTKHYSIALTGALAIGKSLIAQHTGLLQKKPVCFAINLPLGN